MPSQVARWDIPYGWFSSAACLIARGYPLVNVYITMERSTMLLMGKSTISTGPFSSSQTVSLPEGNLLSLKIGRD